MGTIENIRLNYPLPIAKLYTDVQLESDPRLQFRKLVDLFEGTVRHLALIGLAGYIHYQLIDSNVERIRPGLEKPSLGHWVNLLKALAPLVEPHSIHLLGSNSNQIHKSDAIADFVSVGAQILSDTGKSKKVKLHHFLDTLVECRNKKIGHGNISKLQAKQVVHPLELALLQWFEELPILQQQTLVYIAHVEWQSPYFIYRGINLNTGDSQLSFNIETKEPIDRHYVYLYNRDNHSFLPLHPFFLFNDDIRLLYVYHELSKQQQFLLRCPYEVAGGDEPIYLNLDKTVIVGSGFIEEIIESRAPTTIEEESVTATLPIIEKKTDTIDEINSPVQVETIVEPIQETLTPNNVNHQKTGVKTKKSTVKPEIVISQELQAYTGFDILVQKLEYRIRQVCHSQARYPVLWIVGVPGTGKTLLLRSLCQRIGWKYVDFTLDTGYLDQIIGQEETYRIEDFQETLHLICRSATEKIIVIDEIEALLTLWNWDEQEIFFRKISKATRLQCGIVLITRLRKARELESLLPDKNQVFEIPEGVSL
jgi:hypothetical protein